ncbi:MAG: ABC transporter permease [Firmicutes bacterium]|nr:ABC transporter permease [Bacillota bacterium]
MSSKALFSPLDKKNTSKQPNIKIRKSNENFPYVSILFLITITFFSFFFTFFIKEDPNFINLNRTYISPNTNFLFGTDSLGRDIFSNILYGGKISISIGILSMFTSSIIGILYGSISGYFGGTLDKIMMRLIDIFLIIPPIVSIAFLQSLFEKRGIIQIVLVISIISWMKIAKVVRSEVLKIKQYDFILASKLLGANFFHILFKHLIPNVLPTIIYMCCLTVAKGILTESTLSFLGLGLPQNIPSWGNMLINAQRDILLNKWWTSIFPGLFIIITVFSITNIGEYLRKKLSRKQSFL